MKKLIRVIIIALFFSSTILLSYSTTNFVYKNIYLDRYLPYKLKEHINNYKISVDSRESYVKAIAIINDQNSASMNIGQVKHRVYK